MLVQNFAPRLGKRGVCKWYGHKSEMKILAQHNVNSSKSRIQLLQAFRDTFLEETRRNYLLVHYYECEEGKKPLYEHRWFRMRVIDTTKTVLR